MVLNKVLGLVSVCVIPPYVLIALSGVIKCRSVILLRWRFPFPGEVYFWQQGCTRRGGDTPCQPVWHHRLVLGCSCVLLDLLSPACEMAPWSPSTWCYQSPSSYP